MSTYKRKDGGREVICAESLHEMDTDVSGTIKLDNHEKSLERRRDVIKKTASGMEFVLLGIESQQHIHYAMPLRNMLYDGMGYLKEYRSLPKKKYKTSDEFLSGMGKEDRLHPIITLTVYYGEVPWDGPMNLRSMMTEIPEAMEKAFYDYGMNLLEVRKSESYIFRHSDVLMVFDFTRAVFEKRVDEVIKKYKDAKVGEEVWNFIDAMIDTEKTIGKVYMRRENMCEGLRLWAQEKAEKAEQEGLSQGLSRGLSQGRREGESAIICRMLDNGLTLDKIAQLIGFSVDKVKEIADMGKSIS